MAAVDRALFARALDALDEAERSLVVLRFKNGLEYAELAEAFGLREGAVRMRVSHALVRMRETLWALEAPDRTRGVPPSAARPETPALAATGCGRVTPLPAPALEPPAALARLGPP